MSATFIANSWRAFLDGDERVACGRKATINRIIKRVIHNASPDPFQTPFNHPNHPVILAEAFRLRIDVFLG